MKIWLVLFTLAFSVTATAQPKARAKTSSGGLEGESKKIRYKKDTEINFDDALIEGNAKSPFASFLNNRDQDVPSGFLKLRYHWHDKMAAGISTMGR